MAARLGIALHWACMLVAGLAIAFVTYMQFTIPKLNDFQTIVVWGGTAFAILIWLLGYGLRFVLSGSKRTQSNHIQEFVERFATMEGGATLQRSSMGCTQPSVPTHNMVSGNPRARELAEGILLIKGQRDQLAEADRELYDFLVAAANAVMKDRRTAESVSDHLLWR